jgi:hypothetical protein
MSRSVTFNGITQYRPGGITKINANALAQIGLATNGIVALLGEAEGGTAVPGEVSTVDDPALAEEYFGSGDLANAIRVAFQPANDPRITAGAFRCLCVQTNASTQSSLTLRGRVPPVMGGTTVTPTTAAGSSETVINFAATPFTANAEVGNHLRIGNEEREITANGVSSCTVSPGFTHAPGSGRSSIVYAMQDYVATGSTSSIIVLANAGLTVDAHIGNYLRIGGEERPITDNDAGGAGVGTVTVSPAFSFTPVDGQIVEFLAPQDTFTSNIYGLRANRIQQEFESGSSLGVAWTNSLDGDSQISDDIGDKEYLILEYIGQSARVLQASGVTDGAGSTTQIVDSTASLGTLTSYIVYADDAGTLDVDNIRKIASNTGTTIDVTNAFTNAAGAGTAPGASTNYEVRTDQVHSGTLAATSTANTCTLEATVSVALDELEGLIIAITGGTGSGQRRVVTGNAAGISSSVTVQKDWITQPDATSTYEIRYATEASATISGSQGVSTGLTTRLARNGAAAASDLNITFSGGQTLQELANEINQNANYLATIPNSISPLVLINDFDFDHSAWRVDIRNDSGAESTEPFPVVNPPVPWLNRFAKNQQLVSADIDAKAQWVDVARSTGTSQGAGSGLPEFTGGAKSSAGDVYQYLSGAIRGTSTNTTWQSAFDELIKVRHQHVVPLISEDLSNQVYGSSATFASVAAQLGAHVGLGRGVQKNECGGYIGMKGTLDQLISQANDFGDQDVAITSQRLTVLNAAGTLVEMDEWVSAVAAAGMRAGMPEVGEPMTWKYVESTSLDQDSSWDPAEVTDANRLIENGVLFMEEIEGKGIRWVRDLTTWIRDDNLAYAEGSVRDVVRYTSYGLRTHLEDKFTGVKASPANAASIKEETAAYLELVRGDNIIVDSTDATTGEVIYAYHNIRVNISGDIARIRVEIFPVTGINFQLTEIFLQLPTQAA